MKLNFKRLGLVFDVERHQQPPWMLSHAQAPASLLLDDRLRVYFSTRPAADARGQFVSYTAFVDFDRKNPTRIIGVARKPIMPLGNLGTFDEHGVYPFSCVRHRGRLLGFHGGWSRPSTVPFAVAIGASESFDEGITFSRLGDGPVLSASPFEPFILSGPKIRSFNDQLFLFYIAGREWFLDGDRHEPVYRIRMATSVDGIEWNRANRDLIPALDDDDEAQASPDVFWMGGRYHMLFCFRRIRNYRGKEGGYRLGYASSHDLLAWTRDDSRVNLSPSTEGWDSEMIAYPHYFEVEQQSFLFYLGNGVGRDGFGLCQISTD